MGLSPPHFQSTHLASGLGGLLCLKSIEKCSEGARASLEGWSVKRRAARTYFETHCKSIICVSLNYLCQEWLQLLDISLGAVTISLWILVIGWAFYYATGRDGSDKNQEKNRIAEKNRIVMKWSIKIAVSAVALFTLGNVFYTTTKGEWLSFRDVLIINAGTIIAIVFWLMAALFLIYFVYRIPKKRKQAEEESVEAAKK